MNDLERLWLSEFGNRRELILRLIAIPLAGFGVWLYGGHWIGPFWSACYLVALYLSFLALRAPNGGAQTSWAVAMGSHFLVAIVFVSLPLTLMWSADPVLSFCGVLGVIGLAVFNLFREDPPQVVHYFDIGLGWVFVLAGAAIFIPRSPSVTADAVMLLVSIVVGIYYTMALNASRENRARLRRAARQGLEAEKMEAIGRLSGGIAHDFNNILTVLQGNLELYHELPEGPERDTLVAEAQLAGSRATGLVAQLLAYARRAPLEARPVDAGELLEDLVTDGRRLLPDGIALELRRPPGLVRVMADRQGLHAALLNLFLNARDVMDGSGTITLAVDVVRGPAREAGLVPEDDRSDAHLCFSVADDGPGMTPELIERAMEPFFTTKPPGGGSGLGLPMAKGFAEQSGGALQIRSSQDGTIVSLHLPLAPD